MNCFIADCKQELIGSALLLLAVLLETISLSIVYNMSSR